MSIYDNTVGFSVSVHGFGNAKGVDKAMMAQVLPGLSDRALSEYVHTTRKLVVCEEIQAVGTLDSAYAAWLKRKSVPSHFRKGIYLIPLSSVDAVNERTSLYEHERERLVSELGQVWEERWQDSQNETASTFGWLPCPEWHKVSGRYYVRHNWLALDVPGKLQYVAPGVFEKAQEEMRARLAEVERDITALLRAEACEQTRTLLERLHGLGTGETKRFSHGHVLHLREWCQEFLAGRNVTSDHELEAQAKELREALELIVSHDGTVPVGLLRDNQFFREGIITALQGIGSRLESLVEDVPVRSMVLED